MLHLTSGTALVVEIGLAVFCFLDALISPEPAVRWLPRWGWALALLAFPLCAAIGWILAGRSWRGRVRPSTLQANADQAARDAGNAVPSSAAIIETRAPRTPAPPGVIGPHQAEAALVEQLRAVHEEQERTLQLWEADLLRREADLRAERQRAAAGTA